MDRFNGKVAIVTGGGSGIGRATAMLLAAAFYGSRTLLAYGTSKAGVVARDAQDALGGPMGDRLRRYTVSHPIGRLGYPEDIAEAVAYLASDAAAFVTGEVLRVDGGFTTHDPGYALDRAP